MRRSRAPATGTREHRAKQVDAHEHREGAEGQRGEQRRGGESAEEAQGEQPHAGCGDDGAHDDATAQAGTLQLEVVAERGDRRDLAHLERREQRRHERDTDTDEDRRDDRGRSQQRRSVGECESRGR